MRYFVRLAELVAVWDDLVLPGYVRSEWQTWFREHRGITVKC